MIHRPSGSDTDRLLRCTYPYGKEIPERDPGDAGVLGLDSHEDYAERLRRTFAPRKGRQPPMREDTPAKERAAVAHRVFMEWWQGLGRESYIAYVSSLGPRPITVEVESSYALDTGPTPSARRVPPPDPITHEYRDVKESELPMTLDFLAVFAGRVEAAERTIVVIDYKTGDYIPDTPGKSGQLCSQALTAGLFYGAKQAIIGFVWAPKDAEPAVITDIMSIANLRYGFAGKIREAYARIGDGALRPWTPADGGEDYCKYCKTRDQCPVSARDLIVDASDALGGAVTKRSALVINASAKGEIISREDLGRIIKQRSAIEKLNKQLSPMIQADIEANGPAVYGGKVYTVETTRPFDYISMPTIKEALGPKADKEIERLKKLGCIVERTTTRIQPRNE